jgi:ATP-dependent DNA helicase RecG
MVKGQSNILNNSVKYIKSVGPRRAESFNKIGINTIRDLLFYIPTKYLDRTNILNTSKVYGHVVNGYEGEVTIFGKVADKEVIRYGRKEILKVQMRDDNGYFACVWFQGTKYFKNLFNEGEHYAVAGKPVLTKYGNLEFVHPDFDKLSETESMQFLNTGKIIPFYRVSKELRSTNIGDLSLRKIISNAVEKYSEFIEETLPADLIEKHKLLSILETIRNIHFPENYNKLHLATTRLKYEELFYIETLVALRKKYFKEKIYGHPMPVKSSLVSKFLKTLPFELTKAQLKVLSEIRKDMENPKPMNRLLQGDVGSGKTIVSLIAMLIAIDNGFQSVIMAPTEVLALQHFRTISNFLRSFKIKISVLIGGQKKSGKQKHLKAAEIKESDIVIGTHALFEEDVSFNKLGLVVIDEQHRFGVVQRSAIINKGVSPDVLIMTATPIPRTLSMTVYGDLDISVIDEMPKDRKPVKTFLRGESKLPQVFKFLVEKSTQGYKSFIIYPLVKESEKLELKAAETHYKELRSTNLKDIKLGMIHGQMGVDEKEEVIKKFLGYEFDALIATTIIEVGIDIPDANIIVINDAHRFGLSQLHQLRGRVGRSDRQAYCILITKDEFVNKSFSKNLEPEFLSPAQLEKNKTFTRIQSMIKYTNGFDIAEIDLKLRGPGDIFGIKQSGFPELKYADLIEDSELLIKAKEDAFKIIEQDHKLILPEHKIVHDNLLTAYKDNLNYSRIA